MIRDEIENAFSSELSKILKKIDPTEVPTEYNKFYEKNSDYYHYHTLSKKTNAFSNPNPLNLPNGISKNVENFLGGRKKKNKTKRNKNKKNKTNKKKKIYKSKKN